MPSTSTLSSTPTELTNVAPSSCVVSSPPPSPSSELPIEYPRIPSRAFIVPASGSAVQHGATPTEPPKPQSQSITVREREQFVTNELPSRVRAMLDQPFGKDTHSSPAFLAQACFRHVLLPLFRSSFLTTVDWGVLSEASVYAFLLLSLLRDYDHLDFRPLRGYPKGWRDETVLNQDRLRMTTAALLFYDGDLASVVRYIGGPHVGAHRNSQAILAAIKGIVSPDLVAELERLWTQGAPTVCNAYSSEENFQAFRRYGNHSSVLEDTEKTRKALVKDNRRGACLTMDPRAVHFILNAHLTPQGMVDLNKRFKNPRPIFDSSFRPQVYCHAINDWTNKVFEPELVFAASFKQFLVYLYNLRITYPTEELYLGDDDCAGAFRQNKYHPNVVAMHCYQVDGVLAAATGTTFGDCSSPGNWEPLARARQQLAQHYWFVPDITSKAAPYFPLIRFSKPPTKAEIATFRRADRDSINSGVWSATGHRTPPPYGHHVDDNMYAEIDINMPRTISASVIALYELLGYPCDEAPNPLSLDKLDTRYTYERKIVGLWINSRQLAVGILDYKRDEVLIILAEWIARDKFTIREAAELHGTLQSITRYTRHARALFFTLQNVFRDILKKRYYILKRWYDKNEESEKIARDLPAALMTRLSHLVLRGHAKLLWNSRAESRVTPPLRSELQAIYNDLRDYSSDWSISLGHYVPRVPHIQTLGDASELGGGAHNPTMQIWFYLLWSDRIRKGVKLRDTDDPNYVHINCLEFIVVILQLVAIIVACDTLPPDTLRAIFKSGRIPAEPIVLAWCDNTSAESWANRVSSKSLKGQNLVRIYAELLRSTHLGFNCDHISTQENGKADFISRVTSPTLSHAEWCEQIFQNLGYMRSWNFFLPSQELLQLLSSALFSAPWQVPPKLPKNLGRLVPDALHYLQFAHTMRWTDDLLMERMPIQRCNLQLAIYAAHLGSGCTIYCRQIKLNTIKQYVNAVASFVGLFGSHPRDPRKANPADGHFAQPLQAVYQELGRWETVPNRREPFTLEMLHHQQKTAKDAPFLSLEAAIADWSECGLFTGQRLTEWAQPQGNKAIDGPQLDIFGDPKAFRLGDLKFARHARAHMSLADALANPDDVASIKLCWRTQKNGDNGEEKLFTRNPRKGGHSFVGPMLRIIKRFVTIRGPLDFETPLAIFRTKQGVTQFITSVEIETTMRATAAAIYNLDPKKHKADLQRWSAHSYRVGACVILHAMGYTGPQIQFLLRWKSMTFLMYLRNLTIIADTHHRTLDKAAAMPHFA